MLGSHPNTTRPSIDCHVPLRQAENALEMEAEAPSSFCVPLLPSADNTDQCQSQAQEKCFPVPIQCHSVGKEGHWDLNLSFGGARWCGLWISSFLRHSPSGLEVVAAPSAVSPGFGAEAVPCNWWSQSRFSSSLSLQDCGFLQHTVVFREGFLSDAVCEPSLWGSLALRCPESSADLMRALLNHETLGPKPRGEEAHSSRLYSAPCGGCESLVLHARSSLVSCPVRLGVEAALLARAGSTPT